jgi:hypothetical protein
VGGEPDPAGLLFYILQKKSKDNSDLSSSVFTSDPLLDARYPYHGVDNNAEYVPVSKRHHAYMLIEFCYSVYNQYDSFICLDLMVKNKEVPIER